MTTGIEVATVAKIISPLLTELLKGAKGGITQGLARWSAADYPKKIAKKLASADKVKTIWSPEKEVSLLSIYYPSYISVLSGSRTQINSLKDIEEGNVVIEGIVGHGKSMFLRYLYLQELEGKGSGCLPIFIELRAISQKKSLKDLIYEALDKLEISGSDEIFDYLAKSGKLVLMLDGFDEIEDDNVSDSITQLEFFCEKYESLRIVVTSRPSNEIQKSRHFSKIKMCGLIASDYSQFLMKLGVKRIRANEIIYAIQESPSKVVELIDTPLMLTLLVIVYQSEGAIPSEIPEFFSKLFATMFSRHDHLKAGFRRKHFSGLAESKLQMLFETFCFSVTNKGFGRSLSHEQFTIAFDVAIRRLKTVTCECENFKKDITKVSCLMLVEGFEQTTFLHKSIMEYFAAAFVQKSSEGFAKEFYSKCVDRPIWDSTLTFLEKIDSYRFSKFYTLPTHQKILSAIDSAYTKEVDVAKLKNHIKENFQQYEIGYMQGGDESDDDAYWQRMWGPFGKFPGYGSRIRNEIIRALNDGLEADLPTSISGKEINGEKTAFRRSDQGKKTMFVLPLNRALENYQTKNLDLNLRILEQNLWRRLKYAEEIIDIEDSKKEMMDEEIDPIANS